MCNEFAQERTWKAYCEMMAAQALRIVADEPPHLPSGSVRPSELAAVIGGAVGGVTIDLIPWGWRRQDGKGLVINVRADNRRDPPQGRGLVIFDRFYEHRGERAPKSKFEFTPAVNEPLAFAAVRKDGRFALVTTDPGPDVAAIHNRQPVIVAGPDWRQWLTEGAWPAQLTEPSPAQTLRTRQVR